MSSSTGTISSSAWTLRQSTCATVSAFDEVVGRDANFSGDQTTYWREHGEQIGVVRKARLVGYRSLTNLGLVISTLAVIVNPNQGGALLEGGFGTSPEGQTRPHRNHLGLHPIAGRVAGIDAAGWECQGGGYAFERGQ